MYGIPQDLNLDFLLQKKVIQIRIGFNEVIICFEDGTLITVLTVMEMIDPFEHCTSTDDFVGNAGLIAQLVGKQVVKAVSESASRLTFHLDDGYKLVLLDDNMPYEAFTIQSPNRPIIVV